MISHSELVLSNVSVPTRGGCSFTSNGYKNRKYSFLGCFWIWNYKELDVLEERGKLTYCSFRTTNHSLFVCLFVCLIVVNATFNRLTVEVGIWNNITEACFVIYVAWKYGTTSTYRLNGCRKSLVILIMTVWEPIKYVCQLLRCIL